MWDSLKPEVVARLPQATMNGAANGAQTYPILAAPATTWESCFEKLAEYRTYTDDWDGQGAILGRPATPIEGEMVDSAEALATALRRVGIDAPHWTFPGVDGTVGLEWRLADGSWISLEFIDPATADVFFFTPKNEFEQVTITEAVTA